MDVVSGTSTNLEGVTLFYALDEAFMKGKKVRLSLYGATPFSSSFLNSSFGNLIEKYGIEQLQSSLFLTQYSAGQAKRIRDYIFQIAD